MSQCSGCNLVNYNRSLSHCLIFNIVELYKDCPCSICLVKSMCQKMCDDRTDYINLKKDKHVLKILANFGEITELEE